jgi:hypothetical protein
MATTTLVSDTGGLVAVECAVGDLARRGNVILKTLNPGALNPRD